MCSSPPFSNPRLSLRRGFPFVQVFYRAIPHNSKCRYGERGAADAKPKAQIILDAAKASAASGGNSEPKQGQRSQSARGFCPRSTMRVPQPDIIEHFGSADAVPQPPERCLSRQAGIVRYCLWNPQRIPAALGLESCLCLWNIRHFLCFQVHLKCKLINRGKHEPAFGFPVPSRSKTSKRPALLHGKIKK